MAEEAAYLRVECEERFREGEAWRVSFDVKPYVVPREGRVAVKKWSEDKVMNWARSMAHQYKLLPSTLSALKSSNTRGSELLQLQEEDLVKWGLSSTQATLFSAAITALSEGWQSVLPDDACVTLTLTVHFPKVLVQGAKRARASRYPHETPLLVISKYSEYENLTGVKIPADSKIAALKGLAEQANALHKKGVGQPLLGKLISWAQDNLLGLVPALQVILQSPLLEYAEKNGASASSSSSKAKPAQAAPAFPALSASQHGKAEPRQQQQQTRPASAPPGLAAQPAQSVQPVQPAKAAITPEMQAAEEERQKKAAQRQQQAVERQQQAAERQAAAQEARKERDEASRLQRAKDFAVKENIRLKAEFAKQQKLKAYLEMEAVRKELPAFNQRQQVINAIEQNQVTVISGATGCGKSTQVWTQEIFTTPRALFP